MLLRDQRDSLIETKKLLYIEEISVGYKVVFCGISFKCRKRKLSTKEILGNLLVGDMQTLFL